METFVNFESVSDVVVDLLRSVRSRPHALLSCVVQGALRLEEYVGREIICPVLGGLQHLIEKLRRENARQDRGDEQHQPRHHQRIQLVVKCFQADAEQFRRPRLVVSGRSQRLQNQFALHRVDGCANGKLNR